MKTVILCGGRGFRLQEETEYRPKPLVPIGGHPILWHIMRNYASHGFRDFVLCLGYRGDMIKNYFANYDTINDDFTVELGKSRRIICEGLHSENGYCVTLADTGLDTATGGRVKKIQKYINEDTFMMTYGDGVSDIDIKKLVEFHKNHGKLATVSAVHPVSKYGVLSVDRDGKVIRFSEKPVENDWVSAGFFVFSKRVFDYLAGEDCSLEDKPLQHIAEDGELMAFRHEGVFWSMDTYRDYKHLNDLWDKGQAVWIK